MSSVLKALKKLEEEKRGGASSGAAPTNQRWASGGQPKSSRRPWLLVGCGLAGGLLIVLMLLWSGRKPVAVVADPAPGIPATRQDLPSAPLRSEVSPAAPPVSVEPVQPVAVASAPGPAPQPKTSRPVAQPAPLPTGGASPVAAAAPLVVPLPRVEPEVPAEFPVRQTQVSRLDIPAAGQEWVAPPQLTVSEIFPPAGGERMAIVNGLPVMAGTMVDGALVEEIHDDRVLISIDGRHVSLPLQTDR